MKLPQLLLLALLALCAVTVAMMFLEEPSNATGFVHDEFATMMQGGDGLRHRDVLPYGFAYLALVTLFLSGTLALGLGARASERSVRNAYLLGVALCLVFVALQFVTYAVYSTEGPGEFWGGFPIPSAVMLYGIWPAPLFFLVLYVWKFNDWVYPKSSDKRFRELLEERRSNDG